MKVIKPQKLGVLTRPFETAEGCFFSVALLVFFPFEPPYAPLSEVSLWKFCAAELGDEPVDAAMPKVRGEVLVSGSAYTRGGPRPACAPRVTIGTVDKTLYVVGDRHWVRGAPSEPVPFTEMPVTWERAFGGDGYAPNPLGKGYLPRGEKPERRPLPNVEDPKRLLRSPDETLPPAGFGGYDFTWPQRQSKVGTYDAAWLREAYPAFPKDMDPSIWNTAPADQQIARTFQGDEPFSIEHMHPDEPRLEGRLPGVRARAFVTHRGKGGEAFREIATRLDTVRLFPGKKRGVVVFHGAIDVLEDDATDVVHLVAACEDLGAPKPIDHYRGVLAQRLDRKRGALLALRDKDLMPEPRATAASAEPKRDEDEDEALFAREDLLRKNVRRRAEAEHAKLAKHMTERGLDASALPPLPPEEAPPDTDELPAFVERMDAEADSAKKQLEERKAAAEAQLRAYCAATGVDYDAAVRDAEGRAGGPPRFSADAELAKWKALRDQAAASGVALPEIDALLADADLPEKLRATEERTREAYRRFAHEYPAARRALDAAEALRAEVVAGRAAGQSFAGRDLTGANLAGLDLTRADFKGAFLEGADLHGAELGGADFTGAVLARGDLTGANLFAAKLARANLGRAKLLDCELGGSADLSGAVLAKADLTGARLHDAAMGRADLSEAVLARTDFTRAIMTEIKFIKTDLSGARLEGADLGKSTFLEGTVAGVDFSGAKLASAVFVACSGDAAVFRGAALENLRVVKDSSFEGADFRGAGLAGANLRGTKLARADFSGATLDRADLGSCDLRGARFYRAKARGAQLVRADLSGAVLTSIDLLDGSLQKALLAGADLRGANLFRVDLARAAFDAKTNLEGANTTHARTVPARRGPNATR
ncbi:MAG TPA: DUF2169 domain-containing protein [Minicystis sp.]|nr:DUF2169 domain-containing protein [Minicystis sp.]